MTHASEDVLETKCGEEIEPAVVVVGVGGSVAADELFAAILGIKSIDAVYKLWASLQIALAGELLSRRFSTPLRSRSILA